MTSINPSQPVGVGGYDDQKPQFTQQQQQVFGQDAYNNQSAYAAQQRGYPETPASPAPQYTPGAAPYSPPISPPPQQGYGNDVKSAYAAPAVNATELGSETKVGRNASHPPTAELGGESPHPPAAELGGETRQGGVGQSGPSELSSHK